MRSTRTGWVDRTRGAAPLTAAGVLALLAWVSAILATPPVVLAQDASSRPREVLAGPDLTGLFVPSVTSDDRGLQDAVYLNAVRDALARRWYNGTKTGSPPVVQFDVATDGRVSGLMLERTSGNQEVDRAALAAVQSATPFNPLPRDVPRGQLRFHVLFPPFRSVDRVHEAIWRAQRAAAVLKLTGRNGRTDTNGAIRLLETLGEEGDAIALTDLGHAYECGIDVPPDPRRAAELYRRAGELGSGLAQLELAEMFERGVGVERDLDKAFALYRAASGSPHPRVAKDAREALGRLTASR